MSDVVVLDKENAHPVRCHVIEYISVPCFHVSSILYTVKSERCGMNDGCGAPEPHIPFVLCFSFDMVIHKRQSESHFCFKNLKFRIPEFQKSHFVDGEGDGEVAGSGNDSGPSTTDDNNEAEPVSPPLSPSHELNDDDSLSCVDSSSSMGSGLSEMTEESLQDWTREELVARVVNTQRALVQSEENVLAWQSYAQELKIQGKDLYSLFVSKCHRLQRISQVLREEREKSAAALQAQSQTEAQLKDSVAQVRQQQQDFKKHFDSYSRLKQDLESATAANKHLTTRCHHLEQKVEEAQCGAATSEHRLSDGAEVETLRIRCETLRSHNVSISSELEEERQLVVARETQMAAMQLSYQQKQTDLESACKQLQEELMSVTKHRNTLLEKAQQLEKEAADRVVETDDKMASVLAELSKQKEEAEMSEERYILTIKEEKDHSSALQQENHRLRVEVGSLRRDISALQDDMKTLYKKHQTDLGALSAKFQHENYQKRYETLATRSHNLLRQRDAAINLLTNMRKLSQSSVPYLDAEVEIKRWIGVAEALSSAVALWKSRFSKLSALSQRQQFSLEKLGGLLSASRVECKSKSQLIERLKAEALSRLLAASASAQAKTAATVSALERVYLSKIEVAERQWADQCQSLKDTVEFVEQESQVKSEQIYDLQQTTAELSTRLEELGSECGRLSSGMDSLEQQHQHDVTQLIIDFAKEKSHYQAELISLAQEHDVTVSQTKSAWLVEVLAASARISELEHDLTQAEERAAASRRELDSVVNSLQEAEADLKATTQDLTQARSIMQLSRDELIGASSDLAALRQLADEALMCKTRLENELIDAQRQFETAVEMLREQHDADLKRISETHDSTLAHATAQAALNLSAATDQLSLARNERDNTLKDLETARRDFCSILDGVNLLWQHRLRSHQRFSLRWHDETTACYQSIENVASNELRQLQSRFEEVQRQAKQAESLCQHQQQLLQTVQDQEAQARHSLRLQFETEAARLRGLKTALEAQLEHTSQERRELRDQVDTAKQQLDLARVAHAELLLQLEHFLSFSPTSSLSALDKDALTWQRHRTTLQLKIQQQENAIKQLQSQLEEIRMETSEREDSWKEQVRLIRTSLIKTEDRSLNFKNQVARMKFLIQRAFDGLDKPEIAGSLLQSALNAVTFDL
jgi:chromosome segregation ATPase